MSVSAIFAAEGEAGFRARETAALEALVQGIAAVGTEPRRLVLALGGGAVIAPRNRELLAASFTTVWLRLDPGTAAARSRGGSRPLLTDVDPEARILALLEARRAFYEAVANITIDRDGLDPVRTAELIHGKIALLP
jgi:shikimate kinase